MREIPLTRGRVAIVDDEDYERVRAHRWTFSDNRSGYAIGTVTTDEGRRQMLMHRFILDVPDGVQVDHADCDGLNNTRANLRPCTHTQNQQNRRGWKRVGASRSSEFKGVHWDGPRRKWRAQITVDGRQMKLGRFGSEVLAAMAYDAAAREAFGPFALLNFPESASG